ncbi:MAG: type II toxin-antitoxin system VapC family toxin [Phormidesmis sp.]
MVYVLDACAVIAYERNEVGIEVVRKILLSDDICWMHTINVCEVYYDFLRVGGVDAAEKVMEDLNGFGVQLYAKTDDALWKEAARYKADLRRISLADCFALALTKQLSATLVTSDRKEFSTVRERGLCRVQFIR